MTLIQIGSENLVHILSGGSRDDKNTPYSRQSALSHFLPNTPEVATQSSPIVIDLQRAEQTHTKIATQSKICV